MKTIREIAKLEGLEVIETTSHLGGYPTNLMDAIIGLDSFEQAKELAKKYGLSIEFFHRNVNWIYEFWYRTGQIQYKEFEIDEGWFGDNYRAFSNDLEEDEFIEQEVAPLIEYITNFNELQDLINSKKEIYNQTKQIGDDELVITSEGSFNSIVTKKRGMFFYHNGNLEEIGLIRRD